MHRELKHEAMCQSVNSLYPTNPPQIPPCNCHISRLVDGAELREQLAKKIEAIEIREHQSCDYVDCRCPTEVAQFRVREEAAELIRGDR